MTKELEVGRCTTYYLDYNFPTTNQHYCVSITWKIRLFRRSNSLYEVFASTMDIPSYSFVLKKQKAFHHTLMAIYVRLLQHTVPYITDWNDVDAKNAEDGLTLADYVEETGLL